VGFDRRAKFPLELVNPPNGHGVLALQSGELPLEFDTQVVERLVRRGQLCQLFVDRVPGEEGVLGSFIGCRYQPLRLGTLGRERSMCLFERHLPQSSSSLNNDPVDGWCRLCFGEAVAEFLPPFIQRGVYCSGAATTDVGTHIGDGRPMTIGKKFVGGTLNARTRIAIVRDRGWCGGRGTRNDRHTPIEFIGFLTVMKDVICNARYDSRNKFTITPIIMNLFVQAPN